MKEEKIIIRQANHSDIYGLAYVGYQTWITTYTGIFPNEYIETKSPDKRIDHVKKNWKGFEEDSKEYPTRKISVAENKEGNIVGYVSGGDIFDKDQPYDCEMYGFYVLQEYQQQSIGTLLFRNMLEFLKRLKYRSMVIWILRENPACIFYEKMGGKAKDSKIDKLGDNEYQLVGYVWEDIKIILN